MSWIYDFGQSPNVFDLNFKEFKFDTTCDRCGKHIKLAEEIVPVYVVSNGKRYRYGNLCLDCANSGKKLER